MSRATTKTIKLQLNFITKKIMLYLNYMTNSDNNINITNFRLKKQQKKREKKILLN